MGRNILFVTTGPSPVRRAWLQRRRHRPPPLVDRLAGRGIAYRQRRQPDHALRARRRTILTEQYPRTYGVAANGIAVPKDAPSVAGHLAERAGCQTAIIDRARFDPGVDSGNRWEENARAARGDTGLWRGASMRQCCGL